MPRRTLRDCVGPARSVDALFSTLTALPDTERLLIAFNCALVLLTFPGFGVYETWRDKASSSMLARVARKSHNKNNTYDYAYAYTYTKVDPNDTGKTG